MKTFLFDIFKRAGRWNQSLDFKTFLCNKSWRVFTDSQEKEVYQFMESGKCAISVNGILRMGNWDYVPSTQALAIYQPDGTGLLVHPICCNNMLGLILDGSTNQGVLLIDDTKQELSYIDTIAKANKYLEININKVPKELPTSGDNPPLGKGKTGLVDQMSPLEIFFPIGKIGPFTTAKELLKEYSIIQSLDYDFDIKIPGGSVRGRGNTIHHILWWVNHFHEDFPESWKNLGFSKQISCNELFRLLRKFSFKNIEKKNNNSHLCTVSAITSDNTMKMTFSLSAERPDKFGDEYLFPIVGRIMTRWDDIDSSQPGTICYFTIDFMKPIEYYRQNNL